ncbi:fimbrial protein [Siccibacter turicensis]|uniref:fimbrial protein n=1 Tax=Siccibacter turicensis TaxID=357233 RepID=UPI003F57134A
MHPNSTAGVLPALALLTGLASATPCTATVLLDCFTAPTTYNGSYTRELSTDENAAGRAIPMSHYLVNSGPEMEANCSCPGNLFSNTTISTTNYAGSPLPPGVAGYGYLTERIDADIQAYSNAINSPDGTGLTPMPISSYPTPVGSMNKALDPLKFTEQTGSVCSDATRPSGASSTKRPFKWNVIAVSLYIKKPILGEEPIPPTLVAQNYACLSFGSGACPVTDAKQVSNIWLSGTLTAPLSCIINAGSTIEVDLGQTMTSQYVAAGQPPQGYTLKEVNIAYRCDNPAVSNQQKITLTLTADGGVMDSGKLIAKMINRDDMGVRMYDSQNAPVVLDGTVEFPVVLDEQGNGSIVMKATPVSTTDKRPAAGKYEGNVTVKLDLR